jgi:hypothetical protein
MIVDQIERKKGEKGAIAIAIALFELECRHPTDKP